MILSDQDIRCELALRDLQIEPLADSEQQIQPAGVDLRLGRTFLCNKISLAAYDTRSPHNDDSKIRIELVDGEKFLLTPGMFVLAHTVERVRLPNTLAAQVNGRSSLGRLGVVVHVTAGFVDPGFDGQITLELANLGCRPVELYVGDRVAQLILMRLSSPCERPYGPARGSSYFGQDAMGVVASRIGR